MNEILISEAIASHSELERLNLFPGRHLGEQEFDRQQAYMDRRILPLLAGRYTGVVHGLNIRTETLSSPGEGLTVSPGLAIAGNGKTLGLFSPLRQSWSSLLEAYLEEVQMQNAAGIYYLILKRSSRYVDTDLEVKPCQREEFDALRDARRVVTGSLSLHKLSINPSVLGTSSREAIENWVAANNVDAEFILKLNDAIPLGLVAVEDRGSGTPDYQVAWFSESAGRYQAEKFSGYKVLLQQTRDAFRRMANEAAQLDSTTLRDYLQTNLQMNFLPAAGELPIELIENIAAPLPTVSWLPSHLKLDMVAVPEESVDELVMRHLPRRAIDLRQASGDQLRLLLAVNETDYSPTLLHFPQTDTRLHDDIYRYFMRAYKMWMQWMRVYHRLYFVTDEDVLDAEEIASLDMPKPATLPKLPQDFFADVIANARAELGEGTSTPYPYDQGTPAEPAFYSNWGTGPSPVSPPAVIEPEENGLVIRYVVAQHEREALDNTIRAVRQRLEKTRDYLLLQRQQLDNQTVSLAALAGGVAGDGSGLQVARWLPFTSLKAEPPEVVDTETASVDGGDSTATERSSAGSASLNLNADTQSFNNLLLTAAIKESSAAKNYKLIPELSYSAPSSFISDSISKDIAYNAKNFSSASVNLAYSTTLRNSPSLTSNLQFNLNTDRLNKIASAPRNALTSPAFEPKPVRFCVIEHVRPELQEYRKAVQGMRELVATVDELFSKTDANSMRKTLEDFGIPPTVEELSLPTASSDNGDEISAILYENLFNAGKILTKQIAYVEGRYTRIEADLESKLRLRLKKEGEIEKLANLIEKATQELEGIDKRRVEFQGDYGLAQRLLDEDWEKIYKDNLERTRILTTAVKSLHFVRVRQTPVSMRLSDPLELRYGSSSDIVPGCDWEEDPELPEELEDFFDTVTEIPMRDWKALKDLTPYIPNADRLEYIANLRQHRLQNKGARSALRLKGAVSQAGKTARQNRNTPVRASLGKVRQQSFSVLNYWAGFSIELAMESARKRQQGAMKVMSLDDLTVGTKGYLQKQAQTLSTRLEQAIYCLLERLAEISPSIRLQWAQLAEDDRLSVDRVELWPGLDRAEREDFNATRTVAELIAWWFRQIDSKASSNAAAAMRNMIRATLIQAALGDPAEILQGEVHIPPKVLAIGEALRLKLNKPAKPGTVLQLIDPTQRVVALLNVEDDDDKGTVANIVRISKSTARVTTQYRVVANKLTPHLLV